MLFLSSVESEFLHVFHGMIDFEILYGSTFIAKQMLTLKEKNK